jgi:hypothetical protein
MRDERGVHVSHATRAQQLIAIYQLIAHTLVYQQKQTNSFSMDTTVSV